MFFYDADDYSRHNGFNEVNNTVSNMLTPWRENAISGRTWSDFWRQRVQNELRQSRDVNLKGNQGRANKL